MPITNPMHGHPSVDSDQVSAINFQDYPNNVWDSTMSATCIRRCGCGVAPRQPKRSIPHLWVSN